ncbi:MAG: hypothetical protein PWQ12_521 [Clostridiales bacterium]|nr:hypothetical protein [Clostridiales bacterium]
MKKRWTARFGITVTVVFAILLIVNILIVFIPNYYMENVRRDETLNNEFNLLESEKHIVEREAETMISDLLLISDNVLSASGTLKNSSELEAFWGLFLERKAIYSQVRILDLEGDEVVRVNYKDGAATPVREGFQNKADRYYFQRAILLNAGEVYVSSIDLNMENGVLEEPIVPTIRLATPIYNSAGEMINILVINAYAGDMLQDFERISESGYGEMSLINADGYWIYNIDKEKEFSFMYDDREVSLQNEDPEFWAAVQSAGENKGIIETGQGYYAYLIESFDTFDEGEVYFPQTHVEFGDGRWLFVSNLRSSHYTGTNLYENIGLISNMKKMGRQYMLPIFGMFLLAIGVAEILSKHEEAKEKIAYISKHDMMTETYNRFYGTEKLNALYSHYKEEKKPAMAVCFLDIDGLKVVNDTLGHEAGDLLIVKTVESVKRSVREADFVIRFGGDEFVIVFPGTDAEKAEGIWQRIEEDIQRVNHEEQLGFEIRVSHGIQAFEYGSDELVDDVIDRADQKMYLEKMMRKAQRTSS